MSVTIYTYHPEAGLKGHASLDALRDLPAETVQWVDIKSADAGVLTEVAEHFKLHELSVEDCLTPGHRPKLEDYGSYKFMIFRGLKAWSVVEEIWEEDDDDKHSGEEFKELFTRKVAIYLSENFVITYRRKNIPWLDAIVRQVSQNPEQVLENGTDALAHRVIDVLVDRFQRGLGYFENVIDRMEDQAIDDASDFDLADTLELKRELTSLRRIMRDQRTVIARLASETALIKEKFQRRYFKDIDDHCLDIIHALDKQIENLTGIRDTYIAMSNVRLGDIMRILAVITTIAAPLHLVVGLYGMNFEAIPLLHNPDGFWFIVTVMISLVVVMLVYFRRQKWI